MRTYVLVVLALLTGPDTAPLITGSVVTAEGAPAAGATVMVRGAGYVTETTTDAGGSFRLEQLPFMTCELTATSGGAFARPLRIEIERRRNLALPPIRLNRPVYAIMRIVSPTGEPVDNPRVISEVYDFEGRRLGLRPGDVRTNLGPERNGLRIGPLPRGAAVFAIDRPPFARKRLDPAFVTGTAEVLDLGTIELDRGTTVNVELVDESDAPVTGRDVYLEDPMLASPINPMTVHTDQTGRGAFDRIGSGHYRVWTSGLRRCPVNSQTVVRRRVTIRGGGTASVRLNVGGFRQQLNLTWNGVPMASQPVSITPAWTGETGGSGEGSTGILGILLQARPGVWNAMRCDGVADDRGRAAIANVPAGPASVSVPVMDSTWIKQIDVPTRPSELTLDIPGGSVLMRVSNAETGAPVQAEVIATSGGARIVTRAGVDGSVVVQGIADSGASIRVTAPRFRPADLTLDTLPDTVQEVSLAPTPHPSLVCRVITESGEPISGAVVEVSPDEPTEDLQVRVADPSGVAHIRDLHPGSARLLAAASGYATSVETTKIVDANEPSRVAVTLARGFRIAVTVESGAVPNGVPMLLHVLTDAGENVDASLDAKSARAIREGAEVSLGPLRPAAYIVELRAGAMTLREPVRIRDADVRIRFRRAGE